MAQWGNNDVASNTSLQWLSQLSVTPNTTNRTAAFGNTSAWYAGNKGVAGIFGVSAAEEAVSSGNVAILRVSSPGSGYPANATVTITATNGGTSATANATANASGRISALNISAAGSGYKTNPTITIAAPAPITFSGNSTSVTVGNSSVNGYITLGLTNTALFATGDQVTYLVAASNTAVTGLANNTTYYVIVANTTAIQLEATSGGGAINLASVAAGAQAGHSITGQTATGYAAVGGGQNKGATAGWNLRTAGTGGRAGRVQYECLVAMRSITGDASDDSILPDA
jgi:hypothetical protein